MLRDAVAAPQRPDVEARVFWELFGRSPVAMLALDDEGVCVRANAAAGRAFGGRSADVVGWSPGFRPGLLRSGDLLFPRELRLPDGKTVDVDVLCTTDMPEPGTHMTMFWTRSRAPRHRGRLSRREHEVTQLLAQGLSGQGIAGRLHLSPETVRTHIRNAMQRLEVHTRSQLVAVAIRDGLISLDR